MFEKKLLSTFLAILFFSFSLLSDTIIIDISGGGNYTTIQEGIDAVTNGDTVLVYPGTYIENINYNGKNITVASLYITTQNYSYIDSTIIDGNQNGSVVTFESGEDSSAVLFGFTIQNGTGTYYNHSIRGGGIFYKYADSKVISCVIKNNSALIGGGIAGSYSNINLENVTICHNHAFTAGGGIYLYESTIDFSSANRCNIYMNYAGRGCDIDVFHTPDIYVVVDTFTVLEPDSYFAYNRSSSVFTFDILNAMIVPVNNDLYVSPDGDNNNNGLTPDEPLQTISYALTKVVSDSTHPNTIYLSNGIYSPGLIDEKFNLNCRSYVSIIGEDEESTILDAQNLSSIIYVYDDDLFSIENLTIMNGNGRVGGGIKIETNSSPTIKNVTIKNNISSILGGGIYCRGNCNSIFENVTIKNNSSESSGGGVSLSTNCSPIFVNSKINTNMTNTLGIGSIGGISCVVESNPIFINTEIANNTAINISGLGAYSGYSNFCDPILINCTICLNSETPDGTINQLDNTNLTLINCILRNYSEDEIYFSTSGEPDTVIISYTNVKDSIYGINTNNNGTINWLEGNIDEDPMFVDTLNSNYQLQEGSPCIDAGTPDTTGLNLPEYDLAGNPRIYNGIVDMGAYEWNDTISVGDEGDEFYKNLYLFQNKPNPFSSSTTITFISSDYERLKDYKLSIYNAKGQLIKTYNGKKHNFWVKTDIVWDGSDEDGKKVSPGVYFYKLIYGDNSVTKKMILVR